MQKTSVSVYVINYDDNEADNKKWMKQIRHI